MLVLKALTSIAFLSTLWQTVVSLNKIKLPPSRSCLGGWRHHNQTHGVCRDASISNSDGTEKDGPAFLCLRKACVVGSEDHPKVSDAPNMPFSNCTKDELEVEGKVYADNLVYITKEDITIRESYYSVGGYPESESGTKNMFQSLYWCTYNPEKDYKSIPRCQRTTCEYSKEYNH